MTFADNVILNNLVILGFFTNNKVFDKSNLFSFIYTGNNVIVIPWGKILTYYIIVIIIM